MKGKNVRCRRGPVADASVASQQSRSRQANGYNAGVVI
jgi:hypothetical protein